MRKFNKFILLGAVLLVAGNVIGGSWLNSLKSGFRSLNGGSGGKPSALSRVGGAVGGALVSTAAAEGRLMLCRKLAAIPGGMNTADYAQSCGDAAILCQQQAMVDSNIVSDPYCAMVSGTGMMTGPWGGQVSPMMVGMIPPAPGTNPGGPNAGWGGIPAPIPYGMMGTMGVGSGGGGQGFLGTLESTAGLVGISALGNLLGGGGDEDGADDNNVGNNDNASSDELDQIDDGVDDGL